MEKQTILTNESTNLENELYQAHSRLRVIEIALESSLEENSDKAYLLDLLNQTKQKVFNLAEKAGQQQDILN